MFLLTWPSFTGVVSRPPSPILQLYFNLPSRFFLSIFPKNSKCRTSRTSSTPLYLQINPSLISLLKDWKIHKPFCRPNAPCSVIIDDDTPGFGATTKHGALSVPITSPDGTTRIFSSSTMNAEMLKEIKAHCEAGERRGVRGDEARMDEDADVST